MRITTVRVDPKDRAEVTRIFNQMNEFFAKQRGYIMALTFASKDGDEMGRVGFWEREEDADAVAGQTHTMALRSQLMQLVGDDPDEGREEALYEISSTASPLPLARR